MNYSMFLYIDPATGGMLFTILFGMISAVMYFLRSIIIKFKYTIGGNVRKKDNTIKLPIVIFSDHKRYWNVFEPICDEIESREQKAYYYTMSEDDPALEKSYNYIICEYIGNGNKAFSKLNILKAYIVLSTTPSLDVFQWKRSKDVDYYIHIPHMASDITMYRMFGTDYYDALLLSGEYQEKQIRQLEKLRNLPQKEIKLVGIPYMDVMKRRFDADRENGGESGKNIDDIKVLVAPSWGDNGLLKRYGERLIDALAGTGYHIIIRPHPQSFINEKKMLTKLMNKYEDNINIEWNRDNDNYKVLKKSDIMISDFSGVIFDFTLVYDKPVIYTEANFDKSVYDCAWIDDELWTFSILDKLGMELNEDKIGNMKGIIDECIKDDRYALGRDLARKETWVNIGESTGIVVDYIIDKYNKLLKISE